MDHILQSWQNGLFWIVILLMFINWGIEARKWQLLISPLERLSFVKSFKSVLAGCSVTMLTPNRVGEFGGRIIYVSEPNRLKAISLTILGSMSQLLVTLLAGTSGFIVLGLLPETRSGIAPGPLIMQDVVFYISLAFTVILILLYFRIKWVVYIMGRIRFLKGFVKHIRVLDEFTGKQLLRILLLSFSRYMVFILQYVLLLNVMDIQVSMVLCFWLLTIFYLVMAIAPTIGFLELPVRAAATLHLFSYYSPNIIGIQAAALGIWIINLVIPAIAGSLLIFGIKILKDR